MTNPYDKNKAISADEAAKIIPRLWKEHYCRRSGAYVEM